MVIGDKEVKYIFVCSFFAFANTMGLHLYQRIREIIMICSKKKKKFIQINERAELLLLFCFVFFHICNIKNN